MVTPSPAERARYRHAWRTLTMRAIEAVSGEDVEARAALSRHAKGAHEWLFPTAERAEQLVLVALIAAAKAYAAQTTLAERKGLASGLLCFAGAAGDILDATAEPEPPARRYRADLDG